MLDALTYLRDGGEPTVLNCGYGHGYSVREVLAAVMARRGLSYGPRPIRRTVPLETSIRTIGTRR